MCTVLGNCAWARDVNETLRSETKTFDFKSGTRPRPRPSKVFLRPRPLISGLRLRSIRSGPRPRHFSRPHIQLNCRPYVFFKATTTMSSSIHALILYNWKKHQKSSWHYQEFGTGPHFQQSNTNKTTVIDVHALKMWVDLGSCSGY